MNEINEKAVLRVNSDGDVVKCAKGLASEDCGWKAGNKVCGACGAMAVMTKGGAMVEDDEDMDDAEAMAEEEMPRRRRAVMVEDEDAPEEESEEPEDEMERQAKIKKYRKMRLGGMGVKDATGDEETFLCGVSRKMLPHGASPCEGCTGGCFPVVGMPDLIAVEGMAMEQFGGKVLDSGYSDAFDTFVVNVRRKDGRIIEAYYNGQGEAEGWHPIPEDVALYQDEVVGWDDAVVAALGQVQGKALDLSVQLIGDKPAYRVEVDGADGFSYDVFVGMNGKVLGVDQYEYETATLESEDVKSDDLTAALLEFEAILTEEELRDQGFL